MSAQAAQYLRMSTEHQTYSLAYQRAANAAFAEAQGYEIVRTYEDPGVSGLTFAKRKGLQALLKDVLGGVAEYSVILVYDVSRWGRFQDADESAHYEFMCRSAGVRVEYVAEPFVNDDGVIGGLVKHLKRAMAAEYSRELSVKVSRAKRGLAALGYFTGGLSGLGYRRVCLAPDGTPQRVLEAGERNPVQGGRLALVRGPEAEVKLVQRIFAMAAAGLSIRGIVDTLNAERVPSPTGKPWTWNTVRAIITNEKYMGVLVTGRTIRTLGPGVRVPPQDWIRSPGAVPALVSRRMFLAAQRGRAPRHRPRSDEELLAALTEVLRDHGKLSYEIIRRDSRTSAPGLYVSRFGGLRRLRAGRVRPR